MGRRREAPRGPIRPRQCREDVGRMGPLHSVLSGWKPNLRVLRLLSGWKPSLRVLRLLSGWKPNLRVLRLLSGWKPNLRVLRE